MIGSGTIVAGTVDTGNHCDDCATLINLPFQYQLYTPPFNSANVTSNGQLDFLTADADFNNHCLPDNNASYAIFPHWDDLRTDTGTGCSAYTSGCGIFTSVSDSAPNRIFNIEWRAVYFESGATVNFEVRLYEGQTKFDVIYAVVPDGGASATVGVQRGTGLVFTQYECNSGGLTNGLKLTFISNSASCPTPGTPLPTNTQTPTFTPTLTPICPNSWTQQAVYPINILDEGAASQGNNLYSFAGVSNGVNVATSYVYTSTTNTWATIAPLPAAREKPSTVSDGTSLYTIDGSDTGGVNQPTLYRYDPGTNTYTTLASNTVATWAQAAVYLNGKIYKIAGCTTNCGSSVANLEIYDIASNTWSAGAPLPQPIGFEMATAIGNFIYVAGGTVPASTNKTYRYDPSTNTWDDAAIADLPQTRWGSAEGVVNGKWVLAGGFVNDVISNSAIAWDPASNTWSLLDPIPQAEARMDGAVIGGEIAIRYRRTHAYGPDRIHRQQQQPALHRHLYTYEYTHCNRYSANQHSDVHLYSHAHQYPDTY